MSNMPIVITLAAAAAVVKDFPKGADRHGSGTIATAGRTIGIAVTEAEVEENGALIETSEPAAAELIITRRRGIISTAAAKGEVPTGLMASLYRSWHCRSWAAAAVIITAGTATDPKGNAWV
jgi:hypothetical protein